MHSQIIKPHFEAWRARARELLNAQIPPQQILWQEEESSQTHSQASLFSQETPIESPRSPSTNSSLARISREFLQLAETASWHRSGQQWALLYELLWRMTHGNERQLLHHSTDERVRQLQQLVKQIRRDLHKMHAFVRFRLVNQPPAEACPENQPPSSPSTSANQQSTPEHFVSWHEPDHRIIRPAAPFFRRRFRGMNWSILTPDECAHWDGQTLRFSPGVDASAAAPEDELEEFWRAYYKSTFNPARVKIKAMQAEMPQKFWKNLPEAQLIRELIQDSTQQVHQMMSEAERPVKDIQNAYLKSLHDKNAQSKD